MIKNMENKKTVFETFQFSFELDIVEGHEIAKNIVLHELEVFLKNKGYASSKAKALFIRSSKW